MLKYIVLMCLCASSGAFAHGTDSDHADTTPVIAVDDQIGAVVGDVVSIPVLDNDELSSFPPNKLTVKIVDHPKEGIVKVDAESNNVVYRHGGASSADDSFSYEIEHKGVVVSNTVIVTVGFRAIEARIRIVSPKDNVVITGDTLVVEYAVEGSDYDHIHVNLDDNHNTVEEVTGRYVFNGVTPGTHVISVDLSNGRHQTVRSSGAEDSVTVRVVADN